MGELKESDSEDCFFDAFDEFPFHDCFDLDINESTSDSTISHVGGPGRPQIVQRRKGVIFDAPETSGSNLVQEESISVAGRRRNRLYPDLDEIAKIEYDANGSVNHQPVEEINFKAEERSNWLLKFASLMFRSIRFLLRLLFNISSSPLWTLYHIYMFVTDPFSIKRRIRDYVIRKVLKLWYPVSRTVIRYAYERLKEQKIIWKLAKLLGWGVLWGLYMCLVMCVLSVFAVVVSGKVVKHVAERPVVLKEGLNFDYTRESPVSFVPISECCGGQCGTSGVERSSGVPLIPRNHKVQVGVSLTLPESDYNRNLGMFQVQVEALSADGKTVAVLSRPCMLQYKSLPIQLMWTLLEMVPLVTGFRLESQTRRINMGTYTEGTLPTICFKVIMEGRAEFSSGAGVPEIYSAFIIIESRHILLKRLIWYLKPLLFLWIGFLFFMMELFVVLLFFRSIVLPRVASSDRSDNSLPVQDDQHNFATM
ncbi:unnamed protein product [Rhodiola kirilowii]